MLTFNYDYMGFNIQISLHNDRTKPKFQACVNGVLAFYADEVEDARNKAYTYIQRLKDIQSTKS